VIEGRLPGNVLCGASRAASVSDAPPAAISCACASSRGPAAHQSFRLRQAIGDQQLMLMRERRFMAIGSDHEFHRDHVAALMQQAGKKAC
jgi:hypothetical protein